MSKTIDEDLASDRRIQEADRLMDLGVDAMRKVIRDRCLSVAERERQVKRIARLTSEAVRLAAPELDEPERIEPRYSRRFDPALALRLNQSRNWKFPLRKS